MKMRVNADELLGSTGHIWQKYQKAIGIDKNSHLFGYNKKKKQKKWYKGYFRFKEIPLPTGELPKTVSLLNALAKRKSSRKYGGEKIAKKSISTILYFTAGLNKTISANNSERRFYPSGGALYPLEVYFISMNTDIPQGVYHYFLQNHSLEKLVSEEKIEPKKYFIHKWFYQAQGYIVITAVISRSGVKYGEKGYKLALIEAGHMGQNIYLLCEALNLNCCAIGGYYDKELESLLDIDGNREFVVYCFAIGKK